MSFAAETEAGELSATFATIRQQLGLSDGDTHCLWALREVAQPQLPTLSRELLDLARAQGLVEQEPKANSLLAARQIVSWIDRLLSGPFDEGFCQGSGEIAERLFVMGLPVSFLVVAVARLRRSLKTIARQRLAEQATPVCGAISRVLDIELALVLEAYRKLDAQRFQDRERQSAPSGLRGLDDTSKLARAVELAQGMIVALDEQGRVQLFNREAERITGRPRNEALGVSFMETFLTATEESGWADSWAAALRLDDNAIPIPASWVVRSASGKYRRIEGRLSRGASDLIFVIGRDVTDEKALAARLRRSEKLAAVGTLAAGLAHEIRNPLNGAQLHVTFLGRALSKGVVDEDVVDAVDVVQAEIARLSALVTDFLSFARPRQLRRRPTSLQELCNRSATMARAEADAAGVELLLDLPDQVVEIEVDDAMIEQVLLNLMRNAMDAVRTGAGSEVTLKATGRPLHAVIEVHDDGCGLNNPDAPIFDAFYSSKPDGTGLGLAIVHRIVSDHGGTIEFDSRPGRTVFRTTLPLRDPEHVPVSIAHPSRLRGKQP